MRRLAAIALLFLGCRDRITGSSGELRLGTQRLQFPNAYVGQTKTRDLEVTNTGRATRTATASTEAPFGVESPDFNVPGASTVGLRLTFTPTAVGTFEKLLTVVTDDGREQQVLLAGVAEPPLTCVPSSPCVTSRFDIDFAACIETPANEGLDCAASNACFIAATCVAGRCVGTTRDCDDHDACSTDVCDPQRGCVNFPNIARCPAPPDPCKVSACDPVKGCTFVPALDGTRCGPASCSAARVCLLGECRSLEVSEGGACGDMSPCQPLGQCLDNVCVRPAPTGLITAWTVWAPDGDAVAWDSIADEQSNVYYHEFTPGLPESRVLSVSPTGQQRWKHAIADFRQMAVMDGMLVVRRAGSWEARRLSDGAVVWERAMGSATVIADSRTMSRGLGGGLYVGWVRFDMSNTPLGTTIASLNVFNGATLWSKDLNGHAIDFQTMPTDERGYLYFGTEAIPSRQRRYWSLNPSGTERWSIVTNRASPAAVFGGRAYHWDHWISDTVDGGWVNEEEPTLLTAGYPRLALGAISYVGNVRVDAGSCTVPGLLVPSELMRLTRVDPASSRVMWHYDIATPDGGGRGITNPVLSSTSSVIFSQSVDYCDTPGSKHMLREISPSGEPSFSCPLPGDEAYYGEGLLTGGRWIAAIRTPDAGRFGVRAIEAPGFQLPEHGWATAWGSSARDNHAR